MMLTFPPEISRIIHYFLLDYYSGGGVNDFEYGETEVSRHKLGKFEMIITNMEKDDQTELEGILVFRDQGHQLLLGVTNNLNHWLLTVDGNDLEITYDEELFECIE